MYNYSNDFKNALYSDDRKFKVTLNLKLKDNTDITITEADIWTGTLNIESSTSASGSFTVGALVSSKLTFALNNLYERFSEYDFTDASIGMLFGATLPDGTVEMVRYGFYTITESTFSENTINIVALDNVSKLSHDYTGGIGFPATLASIVRGCCSACGVVLDSGSLPRFASEYIVSYLPEDSSLTYAGMISYAAQISGCFARCDHDGRLCFEWYPMNLLNDKADGGTFAYDGKAEDGSPEAVMDGGNFTNYASGSVYDGGSFRDLMGYHTINSTNSSTIATDNVVITGVKVTSQPIDSETDPDVTTVGTSGYVYVVEGNPFIQEGQSAAAANQIFNSVGGMLFRPLTVSILPDPSIEAGDVGLVADHNNNYYPCFFSTVKFSPDSDCTVTCDAESANRQNASIQNALSAVLQQSKKWIAYEKTNRELALDELNNLMSNALGFFASDIPQADGSSIRYLHNKKNLSESNIQWKVTSDGVAVSTDYGKTWSSGWTSNGNMVANTLSAVGINADWINAGTIDGITIRGCDVVSDNPNTRFQARIEDGRLSFYGSDGRLSSSIRYMGGGPSYLDTVWCIPDGRSVRIAAADIEDGYMGSYVTFSNPADGYSNDFTTKFWKSKIICENTSIEMKPNANGPSSLSIEGNLSVKGSVSLNNSDIASESYVDSKVDNAVNKCAPATHTHRAADVKISAGHFAGKNVYEALNEIWNKIK